MKTCRRCLREFTPDENRIEGPAERLGELSIEEAENEDVTDLCPDCLEELGMMNILGFNA